MRRPASQDSSEIKKMPGILLGVVKGPSSAASFEGAPPKPLSYLKITERLPFCLQDP